MTTHPANVSKFQSTLNKMERKGWFKNQLKVIQPKHKMELSQTELKLSNIISKLFIENIRYLKNNCYSTTLPNSIKIIQVEQFTNTRYHMR